MADRFLLGIGVLLREGVNPWERQPNLNESCGVIGAKPIEGSAEIEPRPSVETMRRTTTRQLPLSRCP